MLTFNEKEKKFMEQFRGTDLQVIFEREQKAFYKGSVYHNDEEIRTLFRGASQCMDAILEIMIGKSK